MESTVLQEQSPPYRVDENGIEIRKGYRPPFNSETALAAAEKSARVRQAKALAKAIAANNIIDVLQQIRLLLGSHTKSHKSTKKPHLAGNHAVSTRDSKSMVRPISPVAKNAPQVKPEAKELPVAPVSSDSDSDCPF